MTEEIRIVVAPNGFIVQRPIDVRRDSNGEVLAVFNTIEGVCEFLTNHFQKPVPAQ